MRKSILSHEPEPTLKNRLDAIKPFARTLDIETISQHCFELFLQLIKSGELPTTPEGLNVFLNLILEVFQLNIRQQNQFKQYFASRRQEINLAAQYRRSQL